MKIGMVTACYKPVINGVTRMVSLYKDFLEQAGHEVTVFTWGESDPAGDELGVIRTSGLPIGEDGYYINIRFNREARARLREMDIIHCHHLFMSLDMAHRYGGCPIVYTNHTRYDLYTGAYTPLPQPAADAVMRQVWPEFTNLCDVIITPSSGMRDVMKEFGVRQPIEVIENGVDLAPFHQTASPLVRQALGVPETAVVAIFVGRLAAEKDLPLLLRQFAIARELAPDLHLVLVGDGAQRAALVAKARALGIAGCVHFAGAVGYDDVPDYLAAADIFVTASVSEVHPLTVIEAMAAGLPIAAVESPGIVDTVTAGVAGYLTRHGDGGLAAALVALALDRERRERMGACAREESARFDIRNTVQRTLALYEELRETRPDLRRRRRHGRHWRRSWTRPLQPLVGQLSRFVRLDTRNGNGRDRRRAG